MKSFRDKEVLITGAASGIGRATAVAFAEQGARLWLADVNEAAMEETATQVRARGATARTKLCDVGSAEAVQTMADEVHAEIEALDILMNNAGIASGGRFLEASLDTWRKVLDINLMGVVHGCHAFLPKMVERGAGGHIANVASAAAFVASPEMPVYSTSKFAVRGFTESLRADMADHGIGVTAVCPGVINTPIVASALMEGEMGEGGRQQKLVDLYDRRGYGPEKVAKAVLRGIRNNVGVLPVSPEAWGLYYAKRFVPAVTERAAATKIPFLK